MSSLWLRLAILCCYLLAVILAAGIIEIISWYQDASSLKFLPPLSLTVRQLKAILDSRGLGYVGYVEKQELANLVDESGDVTIEEATLAETLLPTSSSSSVWPSTGVSTSSQFSGGSHLWEEVNDCKDSVWLVQVIGELSDNRPLLDDLKWRKVIKTLAPFGVRTGVFNCNYDKGLCKRKGWNRSQLVLALPRGIQAKDKVVLTSLETSRSSVVIQWVREQLSERVTVIPDMDHLEQDWLLLKDAANSTQKKAISPSVHILFLTHLMHPPLFLAALGVKFTGRAKFGIYTVKRGSREEEEIKKKIGVNRIPSYLVVHSGSHSSVIYGRRKNELPSFPSLSLYLRTLHPDMNDVFLVTLILANVLVFIEIFLPTAGSVPWRHMGRCMWLFISYNLWLFIGWLLVFFGLARFSAAAWLCDQFLHAAMAIGMTGTASFLRTTVVMCLQHPMYVTYTFILYMGICCWIWWVKCGHHHQNISNNIPAWWGLLNGESPIVDYLFQPVGSRSTLTQPIPPAELDLEEGIELLIERLAVPNLWLQPVISSEYVKELQTWAFDENMKSPNNIVSSNQCSICLDNYSQGITLCGLPCGHAYHDTCIKMWLGRDNHSCPVCREPAYRSRAKVHTE